MYQATPTKLRSGEWGATVNSSSVRAGDEVRISTRSGKCWTAKVSNVVWSGNGKSIVATAKKGPNIHHSRFSRYHCEECGEYVTSGTHCTETGGTH